MIETWIPTKEKVFARETIMCYMDKEGRKNELKNEKKDWKCHQEKPKIKDKNGHKREKGIISTETTDPMYFFTKSVGNLTFEPVGTCTTRPFLHSHSYYSSSPASVA
jgi:hypothetical protein